MNSISYPQWGSTTLTSYPQWGTIHSSLLVREIHVTHDTVNVTQISQKSGLFQCKGSLSRYEEFHHNDKTVTSFIMGIPKLVGRHLYIETAPGSSLQVQKLPRIMQWSFCSHSINSSPLYKMAAISQTIISDAFSWMKIFVFWLKFHWSSFLRIQLTMV